MPHEPIQPGVSASAVRLAVLEPRFEADLPAPDQTHLASELREAMQSSSYALVGELWSSKLELCQARGCDRVLRRAGATHYLSARIAGGGRDFDIELRLFEVGHDEPVSVATGRCEICGYAELVDFVRAKAHTLQSRLERGPAAPAVLAIESSPAGALVMLDGRPAGVTPLAMDVKPGPHRVELRLEGYFPQGRDVAATRGVRERLRLDLAPLPSRRVHPAWGGTALALGLATTGAGGALLAIDGRHYGPRCDRPMRFDDDGDCRYVYQTKTAGIAVVTVGAALSLAGVVLLVMSRRPKVGEATARVRLDGRGAGFAF